LISGSTVDATPEANGPLGTTGGSEAARDVWYVFTSSNIDDAGALPGTPGNEVQISTCPLTSPGSATYDTKIDIYTGTCGSLTWLTGNDDSPGCSLRSSVSFPTVVGDVYYVRVYGFAATSQGDFELSMLCEPPCLPVPDNATCATPEVVALQPFATAPNIDGTNECSPAGVYPGCGSTFATYSGSWWEFNSGPTGEVYVELTLGTIAPGNLGFALYNTAPCDGTTDAEICVTGFGGIAPSQILLTPNTDYKVNVFTVQGNEGTYSWVVTGPPPPPVNDDCAGAIEIPVTAGATCTGGTAATFYGATETTNPDTDLECGVVGPQHDVWMKFTVPASGRVQINYTPVSIGTGQPRWSLYRSATDCSGMTFISGSCTTADPRVVPAIGAPITSALTPGETIYVRLWATNNAFTGNFTMCVTDPTPANDQCANAQAVATTEFFVSAWVNGSTYAAFGGTSCLGGTASERVWYSFEATDGMMRIIAGPLSGNSYNAVIEVLDGCAGTSLGCFNNYGAGANELAIVTGLTKGQTYYYSVYNASGIGTVASSAFRTQVQGFHQDHTLRANSCNVSGLTLGQSIFSERDNEGELYTNPAVLVNGYSYRFVGPGVNQIVDVPSTDGYYLQLADVAGLQYNNTYDVTMRHRVVMNGNGIQDTYWSDFGPVCTVGLGAAPTTTLRPEYCIAEDDYLLGDIVKAVPLAGATDYRFNFTPSGGGATISEVSNYTVILQQVGPNGGPGLQYGLSYNVTVDALIGGVWSIGVDVCTIFMATQPENTNVRAQYCPSVRLYPSSQVILAEVVNGASYYEWQFTPISGGAALSKVTGSYSFQFGASSLPFMPGTTYNVQVRAFAGGQLGDYDDTGCQVTIQPAPSMEGPAGDALVFDNKALDASAVADLYPNPNSGENLFISLTELEDEYQSVVVEVVDLAGKVVHQEQVASSGKSTNFVITFNERLAKGMYFVNLYLDDTKLTEKLSVE
jgi:hypothetical protein